MKNWQLGLMIGAVGILVLATASPARAQDTDDDGWVRCVNTSMIRNTVVVDDQTILFYMRGGKIYENSLPRRCPGLRRERRFSYRTSVGRLCEIDSITVLQSGGVGLDRGASCGLGPFVEIDETAAEAIRSGELEDVPEGEPLPPAEPEDMGAPEPEEPIEPEKTTKPE